MSTPNHPDRRKRMQTACQKRRRKPYGSHRNRGIPSAASEQQKSPGIIAVLLLVRALCDGHATRQGNEETGRGGAIRSSGWSDSLHPLARAGAKSLTLVGGSSSRPPAFSGPERPRSRGWARRAERSVWWRVAPRLTALGLYACRIGRPAVRPRALPPRERPRLVAVRPTPHGVGLVLLPYKPTGRKAAGVPPRWSLCSSRPAVRPRALPPR